MNNSKVLTPPKNVTTGKPLEFQRFEDAMRRIVKVSKEELKRRENKAKTATK